MLCEPSVKQWLSLQNWMALQSALLACKMAGKGKSD
jgi:hypothetical protein